MTCTRSEVQSSSDRVHKIPNPCQTPNRTSKESRGPHPKPDRTSGVVWCGPGPNPNLDQTVASLGRIAVGLAINQHTASSAIGNSPFFANEGMVLTEYENIWSQCGSRKSCKLCYQLGRTAEGRKVGSENVDEAASFKAALTQNGKGFSHDDSTNRHVTYLEGTRASGQAVEVTPRSACSALSTPHVFQCEMPM
jgi:hypothetical protein